MWTVKPLTIVCENINLLEYINFYENGKQLFEY